MSDVRPCGFIHGDDPLPDEPEPGAPDASQITVWRPKRQESKLEYVQQRLALAEHFAAIHDLLEQMGQRPFGRLELRISGDSNSDIYRWERSR
jgi:hypothetical protein